MRIGFNLLLWTTHVTAAHRPILQSISAAGYDGVEVPVFEGDLEHFRMLGRMLDDQGLERTTIAIVPSPDANPLSEDGRSRERGVDHVRWALDCSEAIGSKLLCGPLHQPLDVFTGAGPTAAEVERAIAFHRAAGDHAIGSGTMIAVEALNRFECSFANTMGDLCAYLDKLGHPKVQAMYDTFHANIEEKDPVGSIGHAMRHLVHVHLSENDRGTPGRGHVPWQATFAALKRNGYDGWLTIEAFGRALPALAAATHVWRDFFPSPEEVVSQGIAHIRRGWAAA